MKSVKPLREQLSLSQYELAGFLGISRSLLNLVEREKRDLIKYRFLRLLELVSFHEAGKAKGAGKTVVDKLQAQQPFEQKEAANMQNRSARCSLEAERLERKLNKMKKDYDRALTWLNTIDLLLGQPDETEEHAEEKSWLSWSQAEAQSRLWKSGTMSQAKLRRKIYLLKAEAEINEILQGELTGG